MIYKPKDKIDKLKRTRRNTIKEKLKYYNMLYTDPRRASSCSSATPSSRSASTPRRRQASDIYIYIYIYIHTYIHTHMYRCVYMYYTDSIIPIMYYMHIYDYIILLCLVYVYVYIYIYIYIYDNTIL